MLQGAPLHRPRRVARNARQARARNGFPSVPPELADLVAEAGSAADEELAERLGYVAALVESMTSESLTSSPPHQRRPEVWYAALQEGARGEMGDRATPRGCRRGCSCAKAGAPHDTGTVVSLGAERRAAPVPEPASSRRPHPIPAAVSARAPAADGRAESRARFAGRVSTGPSLVSSRMVEIEVLRETLDEWWGDADLRAAVRVTGRSAKFEHWAVVVLSFAPAINLEAFRRALDSGGHVRIPVRAAVQVAHRAGVAAPGRSSIGRRRWERTRLSRTAVRGNRPQHGACRKAPGGSRRQRRGRTGPHPRWRVATEGPKRGGPRCVGGRE